AGAEELRQIAVEADRLGYHHLTCSEHVGIPVAVSRVRGARYYDPLSTFGFFAALTRRVRFATHVLVLPYHHPLEIAKRYGTLDRLCGGRLILGVGVGSLAEEFELLGVDFASRGERYEDQLRALRAALGSSEPEYRGTHVRFHGFVVDPRAGRTPPIWIGGRSYRSLRRALVFADGWDPFGLPLEALAGFLDKARRSREWEERPSALEVVLSPERSFDLTQPSEVERQIDLVRRYRDVGATILNLRFRHRSLEHYLEQLDRFARLVAPEFQ
ncbi:MAG: TIGR03619 family F420-dependent LLM class oxidoreductase, partial [Candidatus Binatia bacterium]